MDTKKIKKVNLFEYVKSRMRSNEEYGGGIFEKNYSAALDVGLNLRDALGCYRHLVHTILDTESEKINSLLIRSIIRSIESLDFSCATYAPIATDSADQQGLEP